MEEKIKDFYLDVFMLLTAIKRNSDVLDEVEFPETYTEYLETTYFGYKKDGLEVIFENKKGLIIPYKFLDLSASAKEEALKQYKEEIEELDHAIKEGENLSESLSNMLGKLKELKNIIEDVK